MDGIKIDEDGHLICPHCGGSYLHQGKVEVFNRKENNQSVLRVSVDGLNAEISQDMSGNPSPRRSGVYIHFECESCPAKPIMEVFQHKGNTRMNLFYVGMGCYRHGY